MVRINKFVALCYLTLMATITLAQSDITIPCGTTPTIDGIAFNSEWNDADSIAIEILGGTEEVKVLYKHDGISLHFAYMGNLQSSNIRFPELLIDVNNDKSANWLMDDWWFHVSGTDCDYQGQPNNFDSCELVRPNWKAQNNFIAGGPVIDTVEIQIPFSTFGIDVNTIDTIGIAFSVWEYWPSTANAGNPSTWANATFETCVPLGANKPSIRNEFTISPNPNDGNFTVWFEQIPNEQNDHLIIFNVLGKRIYSENIKGRKVNVSLDDKADFRPGIYFVQYIRNNEIVGHSKFIKK